MKPVLLLALAVALAAPAAPAALASVPRSKAAVHAFMKANPCPAGPDKGSTTRCRGRIVDHVKSLDCGGLDAPANMQWQTVAAAMDPERQRAADSMPIMGTDLRVPFSMLPEAQAKANHGGQSLVTLANRGGLSAAEAVAIMASRPFTRMDDADALGILREWLDHQARDAGIAREALPTPQPPHADALLRLRTLRPWHYRALLKSRANQRSAGFAVEVRRHELEASVHLGFVQSLNDFFELGDAAEHDDQREDAA